MSLLSDIREYHEDEDHFEIMQIPGNLIDPSVYAMIERYYAQYLRVQIKLFPYMLKSQWRLYWGQSRASGHAALQKLLDSKVLGVGEYRGCHFVYPLTRAMKWYKGDPNALPMAPSPSEVQLVNCFMRAEYFLQTEMPLHTSAHDAFETIDSILRSIPADTVENFLPAFSIGGVDKLLREHKEKPVGATKSSTFVLELVKRSLTKLTTRGLYIKDVKMQNSFGLNLEVAAIHYPGSTAARYHRLIQEISSICECYRQNSFNLSVLTENEKEANKAQVLLDEVFQQRKSRKLLNRCSEYRVVNTNVSRYYQRNDRDMVLGRLENLEDLI